MEDVEYNKIKLTPKIVTDTKDKVELFNAKAFYNISTKAIKDKNAPIK